MVQNNNSPKFTYTKKEDKNASENQTWKWGPLKKEIAKHWLRKPSVNTENGQSLKQSWYTRD